MEKELVEFLHTVTRYFKGKKGVNPNKNNLENNPPFWYFQPKLLHFFNWPSPPISDTNIPISLIHWIILGLLILATEPKKHMNRDFDLILQQKPLFAMLFIIGTSMSFVIAYLLNTTYFALNSVFNGELILLLDSFSNQKWNSSKCSIQLTIEIMSNETFLEFLNFYFVFFTLNTNANISFILTHFTQYGTLETLNENYYKLITDDISLDKFELELRRLAHIKNELYLLNCFKRFNRKSQLGVMDDISSINYSDVEMIENAEIRKREIIALHSNKFRLHIFQICYFDWKFILHIFLFALNIAFMVTQTSI
ncbi:hypothetical protein BLOT_006043 [Blomia tropicalis]|nr:hypothetical protein BLOT_006043 [Blomia tropicalis]